MACIALLSFFVAHVKILFSSSSLHLSSKLTLH
uniref:Uncharacterized protein n=1 Tax=Arundo donax TaxID=35708 RepID=A0A0A9BM58_ARUDO